MLAQLHERVVQASADDYLVREDALIAEEDADAVTTMFEAERRDGVYRGSAGGQLWCNCTEA